MTIATKISANRTNPTTDYVYQTVEEIRELLLTEAKRVWDNYDESYVPGKYDSLLCSISLSTKRGWVDLMWNITPKEDARFFSESEFNWSYLKVSSNKGYRSRSNKPDAFWGIVEYFLEFGEYPK